MKLRVTLADTVETLGVVVDAQDRLARELGGLNTLLGDIASMEDRRTDDDR